MGLYSALAVVVLDKSGSRIYSKWYDWPGDAKLSAENQVTFEKLLHKKTNRANEDVIILDGKLVVYKQSAGVMLYIVAPPEENEVLMFRVVVALRDALDILLDGQLEKSTLLRYYDRLALAVDETIDGGIILQDDPAIIASRVTRKASEELPSLQNVDLSEKGIRTMFGFATGKLAQTLRNQFA